jgi:hypothetical protein
MRNAKRPNRIERIPRPNYHKVARAQVLFSDHLKRTRAVGNCFQCLCYAGQIFFASDGCCAALGRRVNAQQQRCDWHLSDGNFGACVRITPDWQQHDKPVALRTKVGSSVRGVAHIDPAVNVNREFGVA